MSNSKTKISAPKGRPMLNWVGKQPLDYIKSFPAQLVETFNPPDSPLPLGEGQGVRALSFKSLEQNWQNLLLHGDNKEVLGTLLNNGFRGKIDLIYIDPPFNTGLDYVRKIKLRGITTDKLEGEEESLQEQIMYFNNFLDSSFLQFMYERINLLNELLCPDGLFFLRIDYRYSHYLKVLCDEVFSKDNFINEILINRSRESAGSPNKLEVSNEVIYLYSKSSKFTINKIKVERPLTDIKWTSFLMGGERFPRERKFFDFEITPPSGQHFSLKQEKCDKLVKENFIRLRCKNCGSLFYYSEDENDFNKKLKDKKSKFKFYDLTSNKNYYITTRLNKCLECSGKNFAVEYLGSDETLISNNWLDIRSYSTSTDYPTENSEELLGRVLSLSEKENSIVLDCFIGSGTTAAVAQKLGRRWIGCDINKGAIQTTSKRLQKIITEQIEEEKKENPDLFSKKGSDSNKYWSFSHYKVNDYDLQLLRTEAIELAVQHLGIQRSKTETFFDGTLGKTLVKLIDFNHPLTLLDLQQIQDELKKRPKEQRDITVVCLGKELSTEPWIEEHNKKHPVNKLQIIELRTDSKYGKFLIHQPAIANVEIIKSPSFQEGDLEGVPKAKIEIKDFFSPTILERLNLDENLFKVKIPDFRSMVDVVLIDNNYDGSVFNIVYSDVPEKKNDLINGTYEIELPGKDSKVAVKIIDMLGEEVLIVK